ncbi:MAG: hypothetical protein K8R08_04885 [Methanosarcinales archaeon]|jgi:hypothetical protein|nr:MAG: hypothetical protein C5S44_00060 [ANME-2 cluster archaeon]MCD4797709.1 hypothetical protein [Methanosarcinales archaeon]MCD4841328.1 hypothetical protein [Methanosarcinales archaeon]MRG77592.1 hypothetical protein [ANME-2 cluster archaeon]NOR49191.1 hypothetical protein [Methanosarcinaceae archaeon]
MSLAVLSEIEKTVSHLPHNEQLRLIEQLVHHLREDLMVSDEVEQATFESQLAAMATDPEIQNELQKIDREFVATEVDGLEN